MKNLSYIIRNNFPSSVFAITQKKIVETVDSSKYCIVSRAIQIPSS